MNCTRIRRAFAGVGMGILLVACVGEPLAPGALESTTDVALTVGSAASHQLGPNENACWGQATKVFAAMGVMGEHASEQETPRVGLRNLARSLYEQGVLPDDTLQALGVFVATELGLSIDACR